MFWLQSSNICSERRRIIMLCCVILCDKIVSRIKKNMSHWITHHSVYCNITSQADVPVCKPLEYPSKQHIGSMLDQRQTTLVQLWVMPCDWVCCANAASGISWCCLNNMIVPHNIKFMNTDNSNNKAISPFFFTMGLNPHCAGIDFRRQNQTSKLDPALWE